MDASALFLLIKAIMQPDYTPYLDDTLARTLGNTPYVEDAEEAARQAAEKAYMKAVKKSTRPFYQEYGLPLGQGVVTDMIDRIADRRRMKKFKKQHGMSEKEYYTRKHQQNNDAYLASPIGTPGSFHFNDATPEQLAAYKATRGPLPSGFGLTREQMVLYKQNLKAKFANMTPDQIAGYQMALKERAGVSKAQRAAFKAMLRAPGNEAKYEAYKAEKRAAAKAYRKRVKAVLDADAAVSASYAGEPPIEGTGIEAKLIKYKALAQAGDPVAAAKYESYKRLINGGLLQARGGVINARPAGGMTAARGCSGGLRLARCLSTRGGVLGIAALASAATPLILEGIRWIGKRIGERRARRAAGSGIDDGIWLDELVEEAGDKPPKNASSFWRRVYKLASRRMPMHFKNRKAAEEAVNEFMTLHARTFFEDFRDKVLAKRAEKRAPLSQADIIEPIVAATAEKEGVPPSEASEILALPELQQPAGEGFMDSLMNIVKSPVTKQLISEGAKRLMPIVSKKVTSFAKGKLVKMASKSPALSKAITTTQSLIAAAKPKVAEMMSQETPQEIIEAAPTTATIEEPSSANTLADSVPLPVIATASGLGPASADAFTRGGRMATRVYGMAKKMP